MHKYASILIWYSVIHCFDKRHWDSEFGKKHEPHKEKTAQTRVIIDVHLVQSKK